MPDALGGLIVEDVLAPLKDFQRRTVDYVFEQLFLNDASDRFLVADEVGLGKTLVARGAIARAIEHLDEDIDRIDILYVCSNQDIVRQNLNRLNFLEDIDADELCTRITLMPMQVGDLNSRRVNILGLTPGTSFDLKSSTGRKQERALIWRMLDPDWNLSGTSGALEAFQCTCKPPGWQRALHNILERRIDASLEHAFVRNVRTEHHLQEECGRVCEDFSRRSRPSGAKGRRNRLISKLRILLAEVCVDALEPDLIILDEFQRYRRIIDGTDEETYLAHRLLNWENVKLLLLSATPYKMYTSSADEDDHYEDFVAVSSFLLENDQKAVAKLQDGLDDFKQGLHVMHYEGLGPLQDARDRVEGQLRQVMVRNERGRATEDDMVRDEADGAVPVGAGDLQDYAMFDRLGEAVDGPAPVGYWKSAPYLLNVMGSEAYKLKRQLKEKLDSHETVNPQLMPENALLRRGQVENYRTLDPRNGRLRALMNDMLQNGGWRLLWIPASLPYYRTGSDYDRSELANFTKRLVFSSWGMVPRAIATLVSYEAERRMMAQAQMVKYSDATSDVARLLEFNEERGRLTGMPVLGILYPCMTLAREIDPLDEASSSDALPDLQDVFHAIRRKVEELLEPIVHQEASDDANGGRADEA